MKESDIQRKVLKYLRSIDGAFVWKISEVWYSGVPDIFFLHKGRHIFFEMKTPRGAVEPIQVWTLNAIHAAGGEVHVCRSLEEVKSIIEGGEKK